ncbi:hypothetical protein LRAMOSA07613 [Lichtheimia ramosa]|uniref:Uncharacterized protein n=1 Tax=Lichtheimia ramosa TaxID=688394 RepID=A0A077WD58_9FUNG|nr:hypothetical protein LRAMOSA07613 [Lichtheimia ramosa]
MGLLRFTRKDKPVATSTPATTTTTTTTNTSSSSLTVPNNPATTTVSSDFISSSALQGIIEDTSGSGSLLDDILKELHPKQAAAFPQPSISTPSPSVTSSGLAHKQQYEIDNDTYRLLRPSKLIQAATASAQKASRNKSGTQQSILKSQPQCKTSHFIFSTSSSLS